MESGAGSTNWSEKFKKIILNYLSKRAPDPFMIWFRKRNAEGLFAGDFERVLSILIDARFDQKTTAENALSNTVTVVDRGALKGLVPRADLPLLIPREFKSAEEWTDLFCTAQPKLRELSKRIVAKKTWTAEELFDLILHDCRVPYLSDKTSRLAVRWLHELVPYLSIDITNFKIPIDSLVYRVCSRLGVIDPHFDNYYGNDSPADMKIQSFVHNLFPENPWVLDEPLWSTGRKAEKGGHCYPTNPSCKGCLFELLCPKKCTDFAPESIGMETGPNRTPRKEFRREKENVVTEKQLAFAKYVEELKQKGITGEGYREKVAQWQREHKEQPIGES